MQFVAIKLHESERTFSPYLNYGLQVHRGLFSCNTKRIAVCWLETPRLCWCSSPTNYHTVNISFQKNTLFVGDACHSYCWAKLNTNKGVEEFVFEILEKHSICTLCVQYVYLQQTKYILQYVLLFKFFYDSMWF